MTVNQLLGAMYQALVNDIPEKFVKFEVKVEFFRHEGKEVISNYYSYQSEIGKPLLEFIPSNVIIPGNAAKQIREKMKKEENDEWCKALFVFNFDKSVNITVLER